MEQVLICKREHRARDPKLPQDSGVTHLGLNVGNGYWARKIEVPGGGAMLAICHHRDGDVSNRADFELLLTNDQMNTLARGDSDHPRLPEPLAGIPGAPDSAEPAPVQPLDLPHGVVPVGGGTSPAPDVPAKTPEEEAAAKAEYDRQQTASAPAEAPAVENKPDTEVSEVLPPPPDLGADVSVEVSDTPAEPPVTPAP